MPRKKGKKQGQRWRSNAGKQQVLRSGQQAAAQGPRPVSPITPDVKAGNIRTPQLFAATDQDKHQAQCWHTQLESSCMPSGTPSQALTGAVPLQHCPEATQASEDLMSSATALSICSTTSSQMQSACNAVDECTAAASGTAELLFTPRPQVVKHGLCGWDAAAPPAPPLPPVRTNSHAWRQVARSQHNSSTSSSCQHSSDASGSEDNIPPSPRTSYEATLQLCQPAPTGTINASDEGTPRQPPACHAPEQQHWHQAAYGGLQQQWSAPQSPQTPCTDASSAVHMPPVKGKCVYMGASSPVLLRPLCQHNSPFASQPCPPDDHQLAGTGIAASTVAEVRGTLNGIGAVPPPPPPPPPAPCRRPAQPAALLPHNSVPAAAARPASQVQALCVSMLPVRDMNKVADVTDPHHSPLRRVPPMPSVPLPLGHLTPAPLRTLNGIGAPPPAPSRTLNGIGAPPPAPPPMPLSAVPQPTLSLASSCTLNATGATPPPPPPLPSKRSAPLPPAAGPIASLNGVGGPPPPPPPLPARRLRHSGSTVSCPAHQTGGTEADAVPSSGASAGGDCIEAPHTVLHRSATLPGTAPPPPPPPRPMCRAMSDSRLLVHRRQLVRFHWEKMPPQEVDHCIWGSLPEVQAVQGEALTLLQQLFEAKPVQPCKLFGKAFRTSAPKSAVTLPLARANMVGIMLAKMKLTPKDMHSFVSTLPAQHCTVLLSVDELGVLLQCLPREAEVELFSKYSGNGEDLAVAEQFMHLLLQVPLARERVLAARFVAMYKDRIADLLQGLDTLQAAHESILSSRTLPALLQYVRSIGNIMNEGTRNASAIGFKLDSLGKLGQTRSPQRRGFTLLHLVAAYLESHCPQHCSLEQELQPVAAACKVSSAMLHEELTSLVGGLGNVQQVHDVLAQTDGHDAEGVQALAAFLGSCTDEVSDTVKRFDRLQTGHQNLVRYLTGNAADAQAYKEPCALYAFLSQVSRDLASAAEANKRQLEQGRKAADGSRQSTGKEQLDIRACLCDTTPLTLGPLLRRYLAWREAERRMKAAILHDALQLTALLVNFGRRLTLLLRHWQLLQDPLLPHLPVGWTTTDADTDHHGSDYWTDATDASNAGRRTRRARGVLPRRSNQRRRRRVKGLVPLMSYAVPIDSEDDGLGPGVPDKLGSSAPVPMVQQRQHRSRKVAAVMTPFRVPLSEDERDAAPSLKSAEGRPKRVSKAGRRVQFSEDEGSLSSSSVPATRVPVRGATPSVSILKDPRKTRRAVDDSVLPTLPARTKLHSASAGVLHSSTGAVSVPLSSVSEADAAALALTPRAVVAGGSALGPSGGRVRSHKLVFLESDVSASDVDSE